MSINKIQVLTLDDEEKVVEILSHFPNPDTHQDPRYLRLFQNFTGQEALYFHYACSEGEFLLAFFERVLPDIGAGHIERDLLSPWYFGGPLSTIEDVAVAKKEFAIFLQELDTYAQANGIVSQFQRFNPILDNYKLYPEDDSLQWNRKVVSIDLTKEVDTIFNEYERDVRRSIRRCKDAGIRVEIGCDEKAIAAFKKIYILSMDRKQAGAFYFFNDTFFDALFKTLPNEVQLFTLYLGDEVLTSEMVVGGGKNLYHYLRGTNPKFIALRPNGFAVHAIAQWAKSKGYTELNMGGGNSSAPDDGLFLFKKSLSPLLKDYYLYKKVHDRDAYIRRCVAEGKDPSTLQFEKAAYFTEYKTS